MDYLAWNNGLAAHFFNPQSANRPVYLYVTQDLINGLGAPHGAGVSEFIATVVEGPAWITDGRLSLCGKAHRAFELWRSDPDKAKDEYPPYLAYLALFVLAAGVEGEFAPHAYYPRLHKLLGEDEHAGMPSVFDRMWELWIDLEEWSKSDRNGELGVFDFTISGDWQHVGLPIAQTLLSESDRHKLPRLFSDYALDPASPPPDTELLALLKNDSEDILQRRTRRVLSSSDGAARRALVHAVSSELEHWDGKVDGAGLDESASVSAALRLCCRLDSTALSVRMTLRCKAQADFPEAGLTLTNDSGHVSLSTDEHGSGWSSELMTEGAAPFDASSLDWSHDYELHDVSHRWRAVMSAAAVRVFENGASIGLPGYVEVSRIARHADYVVMACRHLEEIRSWGRKECDEFKELTISSGLPSGWHLFEIRGARSDASVRDLIPRLSLPSSIRIQLRNGLSTQDGGSTRFFSFARPMIIVDGPTDGLRVSCDGQPLTPVDESASAYRLPSSLPTGRTIRIDAITDSGDRSRRSLQLADSVFPNWRSHSARFGPFGQRLGPGSEGSIGASLGFNVGSSFDFESALVPIDARKAFLIGQVPGQASEWPADPLPEWPIAWVVTKDKRRGRVIPCMANPQSAEPTRACTGNPESRRLWRKVVNLSRKRFMPPAHGELAALWNRYRKAARYV